jgi:hypothetical protein
MSRFMTWVAPTAREENTSKIDTSAFKSQYFVLLSFDALDSTSWHVDTFRTLPEAEAVYNEYNLKLTTKRHNKNGCVILRHVSQLFTS